MQFVGPIVGEVTENSVRVVVQPDTPGTVTVTLSAAGVPNAQASAASTPVERVVAFHITGLIPDTRYDLGVAVDGKTVGDRRGVVTTRGGDTRRLVVAAVSCNRTVRVGESQRWEDLRDSHVRNGAVSAVLHVGDQAYLDDAFGESVHDVKKGGRTAEIEQKIMDRFRDVYGYAWNYEPTREVLATTSNLMIWDDHEIRNGWGSHGRDRDKSSNRYWVAGLARRVFQEFQRTLWGERDMDAKHEAHAHVYGGIGIVFLDQRGARTIEYDKDNKYLGRTQWQWLEDTLTSPGFAGVTCLLIVTSVPLLYVGNITAGALGLAASDLRDQWAHTDHREEQERLVRRLRRWKAEHPNGEVAVLGGDVHIGGQAVLEEQFEPDKWRRVFDQFITSPITNEPPHPILFAVLKMALFKENERIGGDLRYRHELLYAKRNYAILTLNAPATGHASVQGYIDEDPAD